VAFSDVGTSLPIIMLGRYSFGLPQARRSSGCNDESGYSFGRHQRRHLSPAGLGSRDLIFSSDSDNASFKLPLVHWLISITNAFLPTTARCSRTYWWSAKVSMQVEGSCCCGAVFLQGEQPSDRLMHEMASKQEQYWAPAWEALNDIVATPSLMDKLIAVTNPDVIRLLARRAFRVVSFAERPDAFSEVLCGPHLLGTLQSPTAPSSPQFARAAQLSWLSRCGVLRINHDAEYELCRSVYACLSG